VLRFFFKMFGFKFLFNKFFSDKIDKISTPVLIALLVGCCFLFVLDMITIDPVPILDESMLLMILGACFYELKNRTSSSEELTVGNDVLIIEAETL